MGLLCLTPDTTPIPLVLKEHLGWVEEQGAPFSAFFQGPKTDAGLQKEVIQTGTQVLPWGSLGLMRVTGRDPTSPQECSERGDTVLPSGI